MLFVILVAAIFLIFVNSVFVATEISLVASRISRLEELVEGGSRTAKRALEARKDLRKQLSGSQLGITLSSVILGILAEPSVGEVVRSLLENLGAPSGASETASWISAIAIAAIAIKMRNKPKQIVSSPQTTVTVEKSEPFDIEKAMDKPDLREDDKEIIKFIHENGGEALESELRKKFLQPRTTMWRAVKRLERQDKIEIIKKDQQNLVRLKNPEDYDE